MRDVSFFRDFFIFKSLNHYFFTFNSDLDLASYELESSYLISIYY